MPDFEFLGLAMKEWAAMAIALVLKYLFPEDEEALAKMSARYRRRRAAFGLVAGVMCAIYGTDLILHFNDRLTVESRTVIIIVLTLGGEHLVRAVMSVSPDTLREWLLARLGGNK